MGTPNRSLLTGTKQVRLTKLAPLKRGELILELVDNVRPYLPYLPYQGSLAAVVNHDISYEDLIAFDYPQNLGVQSVSLFKFGYEEEGEIEVNKERHPKTVRVKQVILTRSAHLIIHASAYTNRVVRDKPLVGEPYTLAKDWLPSKTLKPSADELGQILPPASMLQLATELKNLISLSVMERRARLELMERAETKMGAIVERIVF